jgi:hypothetical protein
MTIKITAAMLIFLASGSAATNRMKSLKEVLIVSLFLYCPGPEKQ